MHPDLEQILTYNRVIATQARNLRERTDDPALRLYCKEALTAFFERALREQGATSFATVGNPDALRLPPLAPAKVTEILQRFPDKMSLLGVEHLVQYDKGEPRIEIAPTLMQTHKWLTLPDQIRLPGGTLVTVILRLSLFSTKESTNIGVLKREYAETLRERAWLSTYWSRPTIPVPTLRELTRIPSIISFSYGISPITGQPYVSYGALQHVEQRLVGKWFDTCEEAEAAHEAACAFINQSNKELIAHGAGDEHRPTAIRLKKALKRIRQEGHHLRETSLAPLWNELTALVEYRLEELSGSEIPAFIERLQTMQARVEQALKPAPASQVSIADLAARFGGGKNQERQTRR